MPIKKAIIVLVISAIILAVIFVIFSYYQRNFKPNLSRPGSERATTSQEPLTDEEKKQPLLDTLKVLNGDKTKENLTPAEERAKKEELLNTLKAMDNKTKASQTLTPAEEQEKKRQLLELLK